MPSSTTSPTIRQTDAAGVALPFETVFPNRWNRNNDGTPYEPCTSVTPDILQSFDMDSTSVKDGATADYQTARGCWWDHLTKPLWSFGQSVGDKPSFTYWESRGENGLREIKGRTAILTSVSRFTCSTIVRSGDSTVLTAVQVGADSISSSQICQLAIDFTRATIDKMPP